MDDEDVFSAMSASPREQLPDGPPEKPKWVTSKTNAIKEIEEWAKDNMSEGLTHELARSTGQLPDNVTEARMLKAKIYELSKERYKFKTQTEYEKKMFLDRQQRKTAYLKDLLRGVTIDPALRRQSWGGPSRERSVSVASAGHATSARMAFLNRMDVSRSSDRPKEILAAEEDIVREKESMRAQRAKLRMPLIKSASAINVRSRNKCQPKSAGSAKSSTLYTTEPGLKRSYTSIAAFEKLPDVNTDSVGTITHHVQINDEDEDDIVTISKISQGPPPAVRRNLLKKREEDRTKSKVQFADLPTTRPSTPKKRRGPVQDSRFSLLTNALSGVYECDRPQEISSIVQNIEALHTKSKDPQHGRPKITKKIAEFMRSRGIVF